MISDQFLMFQEKIKVWLRKLARGISTLQSIKYSFSIKTCLLIINTLLTSHLHYPAVLLSRKSENYLISLESQYRWAIKTCFDYAKFDSSSDLKFRNGIMHMPMFLDLRKKPFSENKNQRLPAFSEIEYKNYHFDKNMRTRKLNFVEIEKIEKILEKLFFLTISTIIYYEVNLWDIITNKRAKIKLIFFSMVIFIKSIIVNLW